MVSHLLLMSLYAFQTGLFFALLWKRTPRERLVLFSQIFFSLLGGALLLGWLMYPFPAGPPAPFP
ncbi:MAG: hypothetical protein KA189_10045 [Thermoanaerobaculia bacterium]|jgi:hypothetical protein|nr:hypothetical protein [Thermoanaerobaculia bacterium]MDI9630735.1 hypothetical protein [Acidobacteriota bacterium]OQC40934.1 MAG: hypothetical protein BWX64_01233 [Acidobacteria bacterium ADurb.Bin051]MBP7813937.1 hypothetical protein [Thermoanaerobaculia bacterium]HPA95117.1 hypothetical protein [Thermoanaerobaculia bacterium]